MRVKQIRIIIVLGLLSLIGIVGIQFYWLTTTWTLQQEKLDANIWIALKQVSQDINTFHNCQSNDLNPVFKKSDRCYVVDASCNFNPTNLEHLVQKNFTALNINIEHELAIYNCEVNTLEYVGQFSASGSIINHEGDLSFCLDQENNDLVYFFAINISGRDVYLFREMQIWFVLSLIVVVILCFFTYAIFSFYRQKHLSEMQKDFINNMTHEFKTPISSINIASGVLLSEGGNEIPKRFRNYAQIIQQENVRLNKLVENVLRTAQIEKTKTIMEIEEINLHEIINSIFALNDFTHSDKDVNIVKNLQANYSTIKADKLHLTNILLNLVDNAIKYSNHKVKIVISTHTENNKIVLSVKDKGIGIDPAFKKLVFKKFYRVPTGNIHNVKGFGLGLFYVKEVCDSHGWKIKLENTTGDGACFLIKMKVINGQRN